jgi:RNA polymerase II-associated factor 1
MKDDTGEQFVAYFVPTDDCLSKRLLHEALTESAKTNAAGDELAQSTSKKEGGEEEEDKATAAVVPDDEPEDYLLLRNYNWTVKNKESAGYEQAYFFVLRNGHAYYNELETRVKLFRRRVGGVPQV